MVEATNFIEEIINKDLADGRVKAIQTRHPPEPSGYLHIGHVRNIVLNYGIAEKYGAKAMITTEKDSVKLKELSLHFDNIFALKLKPVLDLKTILEE